MLLSELDFSKTRLSTADAQSLMNYFSQIKSTLELKRLSSFHITYGYLGRLSHPHYFHSYALNAS